MKKRSKKKSSLRMVWFASAFISLFFVVAGSFLVKVLISDDGQKRKRQIQMVTLLKPPPPPKIKEKPPEPEVKKKEEIVEQEPEEKPEEMPEEASDEPPPGKDLGLDAEGSAGADDFGLKAKKGGRALIGGGGSGSLMRRYAWYTRILQDEIRKEVQRHFDQNGGMPEGTHRALVKIVLNDQGVVVDFEIIDSSGDQEMDKAVKEALKTAKVREPPPEGMPRAMKLKISSKG